MTKYLGEEQDTFNKKPLQLWPRMSSVYKKTVLTNLLRSKTNETSFMPSTVPKQMINYKLACTMFTHE